MIDGAVSGSIDHGIMLLLGVADGDNEDDIEWLGRKVLNLRIFNDEEGVMNKSLLDVNGELLVVSQFTLQASTRKGNRPSYIAAAKPGISIPLYERFVAVCEAGLGRKVQTGCFGADMKVKLVNDGPVTIIIDSRDKK